MGFKKGRAARALAAASDISSEALNMKVCHDGGSCVTYTDSNGSEYTVDVASMEQMNTQTGACRRVFRLSKPWPMWQFAPATAGCRKHTPPKCVAIALEERFNTLHEHDGDSSMAHGCRSIAKFDEAALWKLVESLEESWKEEDAYKTREKSASLGPTKDLTNRPAHPSRAEEPNEDDATESANHLMLLSKAVLIDAALQQVLAERVFQAQWPQEWLLRAVRCLLRTGWRPVPADCRLVALGNGSLSLLRLLLEVRVDVCGLMLFEPGSKAKRSQAAKRSQSEGWVQRSKNSLRALMARGAVLGEGAPPSKLLKKLEVEGDVLWVERALDGLLRARPDLPDCVLFRLRAFC